MKNKFYLFMITAALLISNVSLPAFFINAEAAASKTTTSVSSSKKYYYNVKDFKGKNISDGKAIQNALDKALKAPKNTIVEVYIPAGNYVLDRTLMVHSNTYLHADKNAVITNNKYRVMMTTWSSKMSKIGGYDQVKNVTIDGGTWNGNAKDNSTTIYSLVRIAHGKNITLKNAKFLNYSGYHCVVFAGVDNLTVDKIEISGYHKYGGKLQEMKNRYNSFWSYFTLEALHIDTFAGESMGPIEANTVNKNITVKNCTFHDVPSGIGSHTKDAVTNPVRVKQGNNYVIENNTFYNIYSNCINLYHYNNVSIKNNNCKSAPVFAFVVNSNNVNIAANNITCSKYNVFPEQKQSVDAIRIENSVVNQLTKNSISNSVNNGVIIKTNSKVKNASYNDISYSGSNGIRVSDHAYARLVKNVIINTNEFPIIGCTTSTGSASQNYFDSSKSYTYNNRYFKITYNYTSNDLNSLGYSSIYNAVSSNYKASTSNFGYAYSLFAKINLFSALN